MSSPSSIFYTRFGFCLRHFLACFFWRQLTSLLSASQSFRFLTFVLTDNGSEFKKHSVRHSLSFTHSLSPIVQKLRSRTLMQNGVNRTVQEEFANYHRHDLWMDIDSFNRKLFCVAVLVQHRAGTFRFPEQAFSTPVHAIVRPVDITRGVQNRAISYRHLRIHRGGRIEALEINLILCQKHNRVPESKVSSG